jgi:hypothetical protein
LNTRPKLIVYAGSKPLNPMLEHAFHSKGPPDYETMGLIIETLADMEEELNCCEKERAELGGRRRRILRLLSRRSHKIIHRL